MKRNILLCLCSVTIALFLGELVIRALNLAPRLISLNIDSVRSGYKSSSNPILGYELKSNYRDNKASLHFGNFPETNSHGQRDRERSYVKPHGIKRIILLGDSVVAGHGVWSLDDTISRQMERSLPESANIEVLNLGVGGYQTLAESELLRTKGVKYSPDLVVLVFEDNDFSPQNNDIAHYDPQISGIIKLLIKKSHLFRFVALKLDVGGIKFRADPDYRIKYHKEVLRESVELGIARMSAVAQQYGFKLFVVIWPRFPNLSPVDPTINDFCYLPGQYERLLRIEAICRKYGLDSYRLADFFIEDYKKIKAEASAEGTARSLMATYTVGEGCHPNVYGAGVAAQAIFELIMKHQYLS
ncbi:MAG: SGNH/GDSL hydrolase family protein [Candidatus Omnitrophica bacterium]|nr:SGNH/GDSL hydrolase family protein [Candidatus Omnitrophota bacterium]